MVIFTMAFRCGVKNANDFWLFSWDAIEILKWMVGGYYSNLLDNGRDGVLR
jgi:hypothetical protein